MRAFLSRAYATLLGMRSSNELRAMLRRALSRLAAVDEHFAQVLFGTASAEASPKRSAWSSSRRFGEAYVRTTRVRQAVLLGVLVLAVGLTGHAYAGSSPRDTGSFAAATAPAAPAARPAAPAKARPISRTAGPAGSRITTGGKGVALTFDDGPDPVQTPRLLRLLAQQRVHATFCLVGSNVARHPDLVRRIVAGGHTLCNHTWDHDLQLGKASAATIRADLQRTNNAIRRAAPGAKVKYFRAPGGNFTPRLVAVAGRLAMTSIYWKVDPRDWHHPKGETSAAHRKRIVRSVDRHVRAGAIVLSHDYAQPDTIAAYRTLLPRLRKHYKLIALP